MLNAKMGGLTCCSFHICACVEKQHETPQEKNKAQDMSEQTGGVTEESKERVVVLNTG